MTDEREDNAEQKLNNAIGLMRDAYRAHVRELAGDIIDHAKDEPEGDRDSLLEYMHETIDGDGWVIYTSKAQAVCLVSSNDDAYVDNYGTDGIVSDGGLNWSAMAYAALEADVLEELDSQGFDVNEEHPGQAWLDSQAEEAAEAV